jgi:hypothetical protein
MFEEKIKFLLKGRKERQLTKKRAIVFGGSISKFFFYQRFLQKKGCAIERIKKRLGLFYC